MQLTSPISKPGRDPINKLGTCCLLLSDLSNEYKSVPWSYWVKRFDHNELHLTCLVYLSPSLLSLTAVKTPTLESAPFLCLLPLPPIILL